MYRYTVKDKKTGKDYTVESPMPLSKDEVLTQVKGQMMQEASSQFGGPLGVGALSALSSLVDLSGGLAAARLAARVPNPYLAVGLALGSSILGSHVTRKVRESMIPEAYKLAQQAHPQAATVGSLAALPLTFQRTPAEAFGAVRKLLTNQPLTALDLAHLRGLGVAIGAGAASHLFGSLLEGEKPSLGGVLSEAALNVAFGHPRPWASRLMGLGPKPIPVDLSHTSEPFEINESTIRNLLRMPSELTPGARDLVRRWQQESGLLFPLPPAAQVEPKPEAPLSAESLKALAELAGYPPKAPVQPLLPAVERFLKRTPEGKAFVAAQKTAKPVEPTKEDVLQALISSTVPTKAEQWRMPKGLPKEVESLAQRRLEEQGFVPYGPKGTFVKQSALAASFRDFMKGLRKSLEKGQIPKETFDISSLPKEAAERWEKRLSRIGLEPIDGGTWGVKNVLNLLGGPLHTAIEAGVVKDLRQLYPGLFKGAVAGSYDLKPLVSKYGKGVEKVVEDLVSEKLPQFEVGTLGTKLVVVPPEPPKQGFGGFSSLIEQDFATDAAALRGNLRKIYEYYRALKEKGASGQALMDSLTNYAKQLKDPDALLDLARMASAKASGLAPDAFLLSKKAEKPKVEKPKVKAIPEPATIAQEATPSKKVQKNLEEALDEALKGLSTIFGPSGKVGSGPAQLFDPETYQQALPHFIRAYKALKEAGKGAAEFASLMLQRFGEKIKPYLDKFLQKADKYLEYEALKEELSIEARGEGPSIHHAEHAGTVIKERVKRLESKMASVSKEIEERPAKPPEPVSQPEEVAKSLLRSLRGTPLSQRASIRTTLQRAFESLRKAGKEPEEALKTIESAIAGEGYGSARVVLARLAPSLTGAAGPVTKVPTVTVEPLPEGFPQKLAVQLRTVAKDLLRQATEKALDLHDKATFRAIRDGANTFLLLERNLRSVSDPARASSMLVEALANTPLSTRVLGTSDPAAIRSKLAELAKEDPLTAASKLLLLPEERPEFIPSAQNLSVKNAPTRERIGVLLDLLRQEVADKMEGRKAFHTDYDLKTLQDLLDKPYPDRVLWDRIVKEAAKSRWLNPENLSVEAYEKLLLDDLARLTKGQGSKIIRGPTDQGDWEQTVKEALGKPETEAPAKAEAPAKTEDPWKRLAEELDEGSQQKKPKEESLDEKVSKLVESTKPEEASSKPVPREELVDNIKSIFEERDKLLRDFSILEKSEKKAAKEELSRLGKLEWNLIKQAKADPELSDEVYSIYLDRAKKDLLAADEAYKEGDIKRARALLDSVGFFRRVFYEPRFKTSDRAEIDVIWAKMNLHHRADTLSDKAKKFFDSVIKNAHKAGKEEPSERFLLGSKTKDYISQLEELPKEPSKENLLKILSMKAEILETLDKDISKADRQLANYLLSKLGSKEYEMLQALKEKNPEGALALYLDRSKVFLQRAEEALAKDLPSEFKRAMSSVEFFLRAFKDKKTREWHRIQAKWALLNLQREDITQKQKELFEDKLVESLEKGLSKDERDYWLGVKFLVKKRLENKKLTEAEKADLNSLLKDVEAKIESFSQTPSEGRPEGVVVRHERQQTDPRLIPPPKPVTYKSLPNSYIDRAYEVAANEVYKKPLRDLTQDELDRLVKVHGGKVSYFHLGKIDPEWLKPEAIQHFWDNEWSKVTDFLQFKSDPNAFEAQGWFRPRPLLEEVLNKAAKVRSAEDLKGSDHATLFLASYIGHKQGLSSVKSGLTAALYDAASEAGITQKVNLQFVDSDGPYVATLEMRLMPEVGVKEAVLKVNPRDIPWEPSKMKEFFRKLYYHEVAIHMGLEGALWKNPALKAAWDETIRQIPINKVPDIVGRSYLASLELDYPKWRTDPEHLQGVIFEHLANIAPHYGASLQKAYEKPLKAFMDKVLDLTHKEFASDPLLKSNDFISELLRQIIKVHTPNATKHRTYRAKIKPFMLARQPTLGEVTVVRHALAESLKPENIEVIKHKPSTLPLQVWFRPALKWSKNVSPEFHKGISDVVNGALQADGATQTSLIYLDKLLRGLSDKEIIDLTTAVRHNIKMTDPDMETKKVSVQTLLDEVRDMAAETMFENFMSGVKSPKTKETLQNYWKGQISRSEAENILGPKKKALLDTADEIKNWGLDEYFTNIELGQFRVEALLPSGTVRVFAVGRTIPEAVEKAKRIAAKMPGAKLVITNEPRYQAYPDWFEKRLEEAAGDRLSKVKSLLWQAGIRIDARVKGMRAPLKRRKGVLAGEEDLRKVMPYYLRQMYRFIYLDTPIRKAYHLADKLPGPEKQAVKRYLDGVLGRKGFADLVVDSLLANAGLDVEPMAYSRAISVIRKIWGRLKLGYRLSSAALNRAFGFMNNLSSFSEEGPLKGLNYMKRAREFIKTKEFYELWEDNKDLLGLLHVPGVEGKLTESIWHPLGLFSRVEIPNRQESFAGHYLMLKDKGLEPKEALEQAIRMTQLTQGIYHLAALPTIFQSPTVQLIGQFKSALFYQFELLASWNAKQRLTWLAQFVTLGGPAAAMVLIKSLPILGALGVFEDLEEELSKTPYSRGLAGAAGIDISAALAPQLPDSPEELAGPFLGDLVKVYRDLIKPSLEGHEIGGQDLASFVARLSPLTSIWYQLVQAETSGAIKDKRGRPVYAPSVGEKFAMALGFRPTRLASQQALVRAIEQEKKVFLANKARIVDKVLDAFEEGNLEEAVKWLEKAIVDYGVDRTTLNRAARSRFLPKGIREFLQLQRTKRIEHLELLGLEDDEYPFGGGFDFYETHLAKD